MTEDASPLGDSLRFHDRIAKSAGSITFDVARQQKTPIVSACPKLRIPWWRAKTMTPKPTIVVSDVSNTAVAVELVKRNRPGCRK